MYSIGVDIGTSTTEIILSNISISTRLGPSLLPVTGIDSVEVFYRSPVSFTPLLSHNTIDFNKVREKVNSSILESGICKEQIETGAVIITGETARKENAAQITKSLSEYLGDFVVATAGPKLESALAGRGSGICEESKRRNRKIINLDIGGGTLNAAVFDSGYLKETFAMDIGGRLIKFNPNFEVTYVSDRIAFIINNRKIPIVLGSQVTLHALEHLCECLADACLAACGLKEMTEEARQLYITDILVPKAIDFVSISGGVGEYVGCWGYPEKLSDSLKHSFSGLLNDSYNGPLNNSNDSFNGSLNDSFSALLDNSFNGCLNNILTAFLIEKLLEYGDIGPLLGKKITEAFTPYGDKLILPPEKIRATVIGAGSHALSISGSTIGFDETLLPLRNIPIIKSPVTPDKWGDLYKETKPIMDMYEEEIIAVSIKGTTSPGYNDLKILASQIAKLYENNASPVIILLKEDFAKALSQTIRIHTNCKKPVICLDKIHSDNGDYIDIGFPIGSAIPVVIKTLLYQS